MTFGHKGKASPRRKSQPEPDMTASNPHCNISSNIITQEMDDNPPPYEYSFSGGPSGQKVGPGRDEKQQCSLEDQATASRSALVSAAAERVHAALEQRAMYGISKSTLALIPSGHECGNEMSKSGREKLSDVLQTFPSRTRLWSMTRSPSFWS